MWGDMIMKDRYTRHYTYIKPFDDNCTGKKFHMIIFHEVCDRKRPISILKWSKCALANLKSKRRRKFERSYVTRIPPCVNFCFYSMLLIHEKKVFVMETRVKSVKHTKCRSTNAWHTSETLLSDEVVDCDPIKVDTFLFLWRTSHWNIKIQIITTILLAWLNIENVEIILVSLRMSYI